MKNEGNSKPLFPFFFSDDTRISSGVLYSSDSILFFNFFVLVVIGRTGLISIGQKIRIIPMIGQPIWATRKTVSVRPELLVFHHQVELCIKSKEGINGFWIYTPPKNQVYPAVR